MVALVAGCFPMQRSIILLENVICVGGFLKTRMMGILTSAIVCWCSRKLNAQKSYKSAIRKYKTRSHQATMKTLALFCVLVTIQVDMI